MLRILRYADTTFDNVIISNLKVFENKQIPIEVQDTDKRNTNAYHISPSLTRTGSPRGKKTDTGRRYETLTGLHQANALTLTALHKALARIEIFIKYTHLLQIHGKKLRASSAVFHSINIFQF